MEGDQRPELSLQVVRDQSWVQRILAQSGHIWDGGHETGLADGLDGVLTHGLPLGLVLEVEAARVHMLDGLHVGVEAAVVEHAADGLVGVLDHQVLVHGRVVRVEVEVDVAVASQRLPEDDLLVVVADGDHPRVGHVLGALGAHADVGVQAEA